jgi:uncharacterized protein (TIGR03435 family)
VSPWARQSADPRSDGRFEAATVKPSPKDGPYGVTSVFEFRPNGDVVLHNTPLRLIIGMSYLGVDDQGFYRRLIVGTQALLEQRFDIEGKAPAETKGRTLATAMLRAMLDERFKLRLHAETRDVPVYVVTLARPGKLGRNVRETMTDCSRFDPSKVQEATSFRDMCLASRRDAQKVHLHEFGSISFFLSKLQNQGTDRPYEDETGLSGLFEWDVTFATDRNPAADSEFPPLDAALVDQLGLKLVVKDSPRKAWIVDRIDAPTEN